MTLEVRYQWGPVMQEQTLEWEERELTKTPDIYTLCIVNDGLKVVECNSSVSMTIKY